MSRTKSALLTVLFVTILAAGAVGAIDAQRADAKTAAINKLYSSLQAGENSSVAFAEFNKNTQGTDPVSLNVNFSNSDAAYISGVSCGDLETGIAAAIRSNNRADFNNEMFTYGQMHCAAQN